MQEADEQSEGKTVCVERRRRVGALAAGEGARALLRVILSGCLFILCDKCAPRSCLLPGPGPTYLSINTGSARSLAA